ncbi:MAG: ferric reductase [Sulfitobacter sp.]|nr:ferric reductase [Sulfitobacter sp.]
MPPREKRTVRSALIWAALCLAVIVPLSAAAASPLLAWRDPIYILAGFAGILGMTLILLQPLLAGGYLPGFPVPRGRRAHRWIGGALIVAILVHVAGLWITSPPDVIDVLLFRSPTPFSVWGNIGMWAAFGAALLAAFRKRLAVKPALWRLGHTILAATVVGGSVVHALLIDGTMEPLSKAGLCLLAVLATAKVIVDLRVWASLKRRRV